MDPAESAANAAWVTAFATIGLVMLALLAAIVALWQIREARAARRQARQLADEVARPYVVAFVEPDPTDPEMIDVVVRNFGQTGAEDVRIEVSPPMQSAALGEDNAPEAVSAPELLRFLAPGQEWRTFWDAGSSRRGSDLPDLHDAVVRYRDSRNQVHETASVLDFESQKGRTWVARKTIHHAASSLKEIEKAVKSVRELPKGLQVWVRSGDAKDRRVTALRENHRRTRRENEGESSLEP